MMESLRRAVAGLPEQPRVVASGSFATPTQLLAEVDQLLPTYRLWILNAQVALPDREVPGLIHDHCGPPPAGIGVPTHAFEHEVGEVRCNDHGLVAGLGPPAAARSQRLHPRHRLERLEERVGLRAARLGLLRLLGGRRDPTRRGSRFLGRLLPAGGLPLTRLGR